MGNKPGLSSASTPPPSSLTSLSLFLRLHQPSHAASVQGKTSPCDLLSRQPPEISHFSHRRRRKSRSASRSRALEPGNAGACLCISVPSLSWLQHPLPLLRAYPSISRVLGSRLAKGAAIKISITAHSPQVHPLQPISVLHQARHSAPSPPHLVLRGTQLLPRVEDPNLGWRPAAGV